MRDLTTMLGKLLFKSNLLQLLLHFQSNKLLYKLLCRYIITSLKPTLTTALTLNPSTNPNSNPSRLNYPPLGDWWNFQWYSTKIDLPLLTHSAHSQ